MDNVIGVISCNLTAERPRDMLVSAKAAGLGSVEWFACRPADILDPAAALEIAAMSRSLGMGSTYHAPYKDGWTVAEQPSVRQTTSLISQMLHQASRLGADLMTLHLGNLPAGKDRRATLEQAARGVGKAARLAADLGVRISVENTSSLSIGHTPEDFDVLFELADSPVVGLNLDFGHANVAGNMNEFLVRHGRRVTNTHVHDNDGLTDLHQPMGQGTINWAEAFGWMARLGYRGPFNLEFAESKGGYDSTVAFIRRFPAGGEHEKSPGTT